MMAVWPSRSRASTPVPARNSSRTAGRSPRVTARSHASVIDPSPRPGRDLARPVLLVVSPFAAAATQRGSERWPRAVEARVHVQRGLVGPALEQGQPVGVRDTLEDLELLAAGLLPGLRAAGL